MIKREYLLLFCSLQMVIAFAVIPIIILMKLYGTKGVIIYSMTSLLIMCGFGLLLYLKNRYRRQNQEIGALTIGMLSGFMMAEFVTAVLMLSL